jgi:MFS family permease
MRELLRRRDFRRLFVGVVATMVGESALLLVLAIWVKDMTGSNSLAGLTLFMLVAPALAAPLLGWVVDRFRRKPFLVVVVFSTVVVLAPLMLVRDRDDIWIIYVVGVLYGASILMVSAALNGLIKELLPEAMLADANGILQTFRQGLRLVAPLGGAGVYTAVGGPAVVAIDMACLIIGGCAIASIPIREERPTSSEMHWLGEVGAGLRHLFAPPALRRSTIALAVSVAVVGFIETLVFAYVDLGLHRGPAFVSVIVCVQGVGGLTGGLTAARVVRRLGEVGTTAVGIALFGVGFAGLIYPHLALAFASAIVLGVGIPWAIVGFNTLMQRITPAAVLGRVSAASEAVISTPQALSIAAGAALVAVVDYRLLFAFMAVTMAICAVYLWAGRSLSPPPAEEPGQTGAAAPPAGAAPVAVPVPDAAPVAARVPDAAPVPVATAASDLGAVPLDLGEAVPDLDDGRIGQD